MAVPFPFPLELFIFGPLLVGGGVLLVWLLPRLIGRWRQARYDETVASEQERFEIVAPGRPAKDEATPRELIRALAVTHRLGDDRGGKGWPTFELRCVWRDGELVWQFQGGRQMAVIAQHALGSLYPGHRDPAAAGPGRACGRERHRPPDRAVALAALVAPPPRIAAGNGAALTIGESRDGPLRLPVDALARHMAVIGATGSGKSTLLMSLALGVLETPVGATVIDPHGDLAADILARIPPRHADRVHVLRLGDKAHPRGFNFLERRETDEPQLVASEFVALFHDLWPDYTGPKMQHYLRHALLTMLAQPKPQTVIELIRILTDDDFRERYTRTLDDPMLVNFWRHEWPSGAARERDTSIKAVLNKLGAFVSYHSIRNVVGQGQSTIRPRRIMDAGDLLVVDLSRVGGDNARLFGAMLISRYYIDAVGRQGTPRESRRPHLLIVDEVPTFDTRALEKIHDEGRKFGLQLVTAAQSLNGLGMRLRDSVLTNAGVLALLSPSADDVQALRRVMAPLSPEDLLSMRQHEMVIRMTGPDGRAGVFGGMVCPPPPGDARVAEALIRASDARDARPLDQVEAEVRRRAGGAVEPPPDGTPRLGPTDPK